MVGFFRVASKSRKPACPLSDINKRVISKKKFSNRSTNNEIYPNANGAQRKCIPFNSEISRILSEWAALPKFYVFRSVDFASQVMVSQLVGQQAVSYIDFRVYLCSLLEFV